MDKDYIIIATDLKNRFAIRLACLHHSLKKSLESHQMAKTLEPFYCNFVLASVLLGSRSDDLETYLFKLKLKDNPFHINAEVMPTGPFRTAIYPTENKNQFNGEITGELHVTRLKKNDELYQSMTALSPNNIQESFQHYINQSIQRDSLLILNGQNKNLDQNFGIWVECLPQTTQEDWLVLKNHLLSQNLEALINQTTDPDKICNALFKNDFRILAVTQPRLECGCNKDKILGALQLLQTEELVELFIDGKGIETECDYCHKVWHVDDSEIKDLFVKGQTIN